MRRKEKAHDRAVEKIKERLTEEARHHPQVPEVVNSLVGNQLDNADYLFPETFERIVELANSFR